MSLSILRCPNCEQRYSQKHHTNRFGNFKIYYHLVNASNPESYIIFKCLKCGNKYRLDLNKCSEFELTEVIIKE